MSVLDRLVDWQRAQSAREGVEAYRVLPYTTLVALARAMPENELALMNVKGIGAVKVRRYGAALLQVLHATAGPAVPAPPQPLPATGPAATMSSDRATGERDEALSVSAFLDAINAQITGSRARVRGEVVSMSDYGRTVYFTIKDAADGSVLPCLIFRTQYDVAGVVLTEGMDVIVTGAPEIYKPNGRFSLKASMIELAGEGALKKAYDALKKKLTDEGLLDVARKRPIPLLPRIIGLVTSRDSAAIGDFMTNLGRYGFTIRLVHSAVEGARAVPELLNAIARLAREDVDVLVIVRGGGSLESLQAFNNETVVRALAAFGAPVVAGIGHDRDETIATLAADVGVSTPTAAARAVRESWDRAAETLMRQQQRLLGAYTAALATVRSVLDRAPHSLLRPVRRLLDRFGAVENRFASCIMRQRQEMRERQGVLAYAARDLARHGRDMTAAVRTRLDSAVRLLAASDPHRRLAQGYAIVRGADGRVVRSVRAATGGDALSIQVSDGTIGVVAKSEK